MRKRRLPSAATTQQILVQNIFNSPSSHKAIATTPKRTQRINPTFAPLRLIAVIRISSCHSQTSSRHSNDANSRITMAATYAPSVYTRRRPGHVLGPPPNGVNCHVGLAVAQRSGLNVSASAPQKSLSR